MKLAFIGIHWPQSYVNSVAECRMVRFARAYTSPNIEMPVILITDLGLL